MNKIVYTGGSFEVPHLGHMNFLRQCSMLGDVIISLNTDEFIESYKGHRPTFSYKERENLLRLVPFVKDVVPNICGADSKPAILNVNPDIIAIGTDWASKDYYKQMNFTQDWLDENRIVLVYIPYTEIVSTTTIKQRIKNEP